MRVGCLRRTTPSAALLSCPPGWWQRAPVRPPPAARAAAPAAHGKARRAASTPSLTLTTGYAAINEGTVNPVTVTVTFPVAITSGTIGLIGANAPHCTPLALSGRPHRGHLDLLEHRRVTGKGHAARDRDGDRSRPLGVAVLAGVRHRHPPRAAGRAGDDVRRTSSCGNHSPYVWLTFDDYGSTAQVRSILATLRRNDVQGADVPDRDLGQRQPVTRLGDEA